MGLISNLCCEYLILLTLMDYDYVHVDNILVNW